MRKYRVVLLQGDGIGPILAGECADLLEILGRQHGFTCETVRCPFGKGAWEEYGVALPDQTISEILAADAALAAAVDSAGVVGTTPVGLLRKKLNLFADVRPIRSRPGCWSLKPDIDLVFIREITQGFLPDRNLFAGSGEWMSDSKTAFSMRLITYEASRRIAEYAFAFAEKNNRKKVTAIHKASVFKMTCGTFLTACRDVAAEHPDVTYEEAVADEAANALITCPEQFDVLLTTNLFGDILSDEAAALVASLAPSVNCGAEASVYLPITHAPDYKGLDSLSYNPVPTLLCLHMLLSDLGEHQAAGDLNDAINQLLKQPEHQAAKSLELLRRVLKH